MLRCGTSVRVVEVRSYGAFLYLKEPDLRKCLGEADGVTLSQCLADGRVPVPDRMSFPKWQQWRKAEGRRPTKRKDGVGLSTGQEVALWRATMEELYGKDEAEAADDSDDDDDADDGGSSELRRVVAGPPAMPAALVSCWRREVGG